MAFDDETIETPDTTDAEASSAAEAPMAFEPPSPLEPMSPKKRTGLVVVVAALLLLLVAAVAGVAVLAPTFGGKSTAVKPDATQDKARITVAIGAMEALRINDIGAVKPFLTDKAQSAITAEEWVAAAGASAVPTATFSSPKWASESSATVDYDIEGSTGTMAFAPNPTKPNVVTMTESSADGDLIYDIELVQVGSAWRVVSLTPKAETFLLDEAFVKSLADTSTTP